VKKLQRFVTKVTTSATKVTTSATFAREIDIDITLLSCYDINIPKNHKEGKMLLNDMEIIKRMRERKLTSLSLALAAGISPITISRLLNGHKMPLVETIVKICKPLGASPNDLINWR
jgi:DNA-binding Xre family transcriptional regulator